MMKKILIHCIPVMALAWMCSAARAESENIRAFVSIPPQAYFVERVGAPYVDAEVLVGPGRSPATYEPTPKQIARLASSHVYFSIGVPFEKGFVEKLADSHRSLKIVDMRKSVKLRNFGGVELRYYKKAKGPRIPSDPHIWLDPKQAKIQAETIYEALTHLAPGHSSAFEKNLTSFQADLDRVDRKIARTLYPHKGEKFYVFHPAFGYIADAYGLIQVAVEIEGKEPTPEQLADLIEMAKKDRVKVIFVQPQFASKSAETIAKAIGGVVVPIDPLSQDYLENLEKIADALKAAFVNR